MSRTILVLVSFAGGIAVGLLIADTYAKNRATGVVDSALNALHLGGGVIQGVADQYVPTLVG
jgi:hypothetical protein